MEVEVSSDFKLALKVRDARGRTRTVGHYSAHHTEKLGGGVVPHLQRVDPTGRFLASYDGDRSRIVVDALDGSRASFAVEVEDAPAKVRQFRWLADGRGMMIAAADQIHLLPLDPRAPADRSRATAVLADGDVPLEVQDVRMMDGGMLVRVDYLHQQEVPPEPLGFRTGVDFVFGDTRIAEHEVTVGDPDYWEYRDAADYDDGGLINRRGQALFVKLDGTTATATQALASPDQSVTAAMVLSGGRVAAMVGPFQTGLWAESDADSMWITTPGAEGWTVAQREGCADDCQASNWVPGATVPIRARWNNVIVGGQGGHTLEVPGDHVNVLWADEGRDLLLAGTTQTLVLWDGQVERWRHSPSDVALQSARFDPTGRYVYAATDGEILRLSTATGKSTAIVKIRSYVEDDYQESEDEDDWSFTSTTEVRRLDGVVPLPGGGVAYAVLEAEEQTEAI